MMNEQSLVSHVAKFLDDESGASAIEYSLIAGSVAVGIIGSASELGVSLSGTFQTIAEALEGAPLPGPSNSDPGGNGGIIGG